MRETDISTLPVELVLEILRLAATPVFNSLGQRNCSSNKTTMSMYTTACILALVSHNFRHAVMPYILHTVILNSQNSLDLFLRSVQQQTKFAATKSSLKIDYVRYVRRIWSTECNLPVVDQSADSYRDYSLLYPIFTKAYDIGLNVQSTHLLHEALDGEHLFSDRSLGWVCQRATIAGSNMRWNTLMTTAPGNSFLRQLRRLTLWSERPAELVNGVPDWIHKVPLECMPNLTHFAFSFRGTSDNLFALPILVYVLPHKLLGTAPGGILVRKWLSEPTPTKSPDTFIRYLDLHEFSVSPSAYWENAFLWGDNNVWEAPPEVPKRPEYLTRTAIRHICSIFGPSSLPSKQYYTT